MQAVRLNRTAQWLDSGLDGNLLEEGLEEGPELRYAGDVATLVGVWGERRVGPKLTRSMWG